MLKAVDSFLGWMAVSLAVLFPLKAKRSGTINSILLIRPGGIGDAVLLIPAIQTIRKHFPSAQITMLAERRNASAFQLCTDVSTVLLYGRPADLVTAMRGTYDVVIDTEQWHRLSAVVARITRAPILIGYATNERSRLFTHPVDYSHDDYETLSFLHLIAPLDIEPDQPPERFLVIPASGTKKAEELLAPLSGRLFVALFPGASIPERRWGAVKFRRLMELLTVLEIAVVVVGGKEDREQGEVMVSGGIGLNLAGLTTLTETATVIGKSACLVSGDSGVLHIAVGLGKPTVSLFGPGRAKKWAPRGDHHIVINRGIPCSPCTTFGSTRKCPTAQCMKDITVDEVFNAVMMILRSTNAIDSLCCKRDWIEVSAG